ncbi:MAG: hypothetical protein A4E60_03528 [Syntrophorhabdus sp. PtaB.Bin047]|nr:MAG: hypothetical protein A4E60_03528 [Syntrophorhabdus sp. PtaB.Bin047]
MEKTEEPVDDPGIGPAGLQLPEDLFVVAHLNELSCHPEPEKHIAQRYVVGIGLYHRNALSLELHEGVERLSPHRVDLAPVRHNAVARKIRVPDPVFRKGHGREDVYLPVPQHFQAVVPIARDIGDSPSLVVCHVADDIHEEAFPLAFVVHGRHGEVGFGGDTHRPLCRSRLRRKREKENHDNGCYQRAGEAWKGFTRHGLPFDLSGMHCVLKCPEPFKRSRSLFLLPSGSNNSSRLQSFSFSPESFFSAPSSGFISAIFILSLTSLGLSA